MSHRSSIRVAVNGFGVIGKRVADAVLLQDDMELAVSAMLPATGVYAYYSKRKSRSMRPPTRRSAR